MSVATQRNDVLTWIFPHSGRQLGKHLRNPSRSIQQPGSIRILSNTLEDQAHAAGDGLEVDWSRLLSFSGKLGNHLIPSWRYLSAFSCSCFLARAIRAASSTTRNGTFAFSAAA